VLLLLLLLAMPVQWRCVRCLFQQLLTEVSRLQHYQQQQHLAGHLS
jgi:hypothetical protein